MFSSLSWWHLVILSMVVLVPLVVVVVVIRARRARKTGDPTPIVSLTLTVSAAWAAFSLIAAAMTVVSSLASTQVTMTVPVRQYWPSDLPGVTIVDGPTAQVVAGGFTSAQLTLEGLSTAPRVLWAIGQGVGLLIPTTIATLIAVACFQLLAGRAFAPVVARMAIVTAVVVLVGGLATQILSGLAGSMASTEALLVTSSTWTGYPDDVIPTDFLPQPTFAMAVDFWPVAASLGFAALAAVFRYGSKLQRDTEGLV